MMKNGRIWIMVFAVCMLLTACGKEDHGSDMEVNESESGEQSSYAASGSLENSEGIGQSLEGSGENEQSLENSEGTGQSLEGSGEIIKSLESNEDIETAREQIWQEYIEQVKQDEVRAQEVEDGSMTFGEATMKYGMVVKGQPGESGYSLFIALHGGGGSDTPDLNDSQWMDMGVYYLSSVRNGIYVFPRGVRDTWDCHFNPESYPLYDRLIENMIAFYDVDPNKVYLTGFSAGGDGVYAIVARMSDRFAAANMSAGHPNSVPLYNIYNMPLQLQVGENDTAYDRNICTAQYGQLLDGYQEELGGGYVHGTYVHKGKGHNFYDNGFSKQKVMADSAAWLESGDDSVIEVETNAIRILEQYVRNPLPERVVWDLSQRADQRTDTSFYWLQADGQLREGRIIASYDRETNSVTVEECTVKGEITFWLSNDMLDLFAPVTLNTSGESRTVTVTPEYNLLYETTLERGDNNYQFAAKISVVFE